MDYFMITFHLPNQLDYSNIYQYFTDYELTL